MLVNYWSNFGLLSLFSLIRPKIPLAGLTLVITMAIRSGGGGSLLRGAFYCLAGEKPLKCVPVEWEVLMSSVQTLRVQSNLENQNLWWQPF